MTSSDVTAFHIKWCDDTKNDVEMALSNAMPDVCVKTVPYSKDIPFDEWNALRRLAEMKNLCNTPYALVIRDSYLSQGGSIEFALKRFENDLQKNLNLVMEHLVSSKPSQDFVWEAKFAANADFAIGKSEQILNSCKQEVNQ